MQSFNYRSVLRLLGSFLLIEGGALFLVVLLNISFQETGLTTFFFTACLTTCMGAFLFFFFRESNPHIGKKEGFVAVSLTWTVLSLLGAIPMYYSGALPTYTDAFFEVISGFTTTGITVFQDLDNSLHTALLWRALTQWLGGLGIIVLLVALMPQLRTGGVQIFLAEGQGPSPEKLHPRIAETAKRLWYIYILLTATQMLLLWSGGMEWFDALCHSLTTMASGGYSTKGASIGHWDSPFIHYVVMLFMFFSATNFTLFYLFFLGRGMRFFKDEEFRYYILIILFASSVIAGAYLLNMPNTSVEYAIRTALFHVTSTLTTTGYVIEDIDQTLIPGSKFLLISLMFIGGCTGSTGGGPKVIRIVALLKISIYELRKMLHSHVVAPVRINKKGLPLTVINYITSFIVIYFAIFLFSLVILSFIEDDLMTVISSVTTCIGNVGIGFSKVGPTQNYAFYSDGVKWFLSLLMLLGRLEIFPVIIIFSRWFWRK